LQAIHLRETAAGLYLYAANSKVFPNVGTDAYAAYIRTLLEDAGSPTDPIERQLIEQATQAHHAVGRLLFKASQVEAPEAAGVYLTAAARLMGEHRRTALAIRSYRSPAAPQVTVVQQNVAAVETKVAVAAIGEGAGTVRSENTRDGELGGTGQEGKDEHTERVA
jgi:hypothetical protein